MKVKVKTCFFSFWNIFAEMFGCSEIYLLLCAVLLRLHAR